MTLMKSLSAPQPPLWSHGWTQHHFWSSLLAASQDPEISLSSQHMLLGHPQLEEIRAFPQHCLSVDFSVFRLCPMVKKKIIHHDPLLNHPFSLFFKGRKSEAEKFFLKAIELDPTKGNCYMHYGEWWCFSNAPIGSLLVRDLWEEVDFLLPDLASCSILPFPFKTSHSGGLRTMFSFSEFSSAFNGLGRFPIVSFKFSAAF